jgi:cytochrome c556
MRSLSLKLAAALVVLGAGAAAAKVNVRAVMHERHEGMEAMGKAFKTLHREFDSSSPDVATVRASANQIGNLAKKSSRWFVLGTGPEAGKTGAKPEIWQNWPDFVAKNRAFQQSARAFKAIAAKGDMTAAKASYADLAGTCKACHDKYRMEMHH